MREDSLPLHAILLPERLHRVTIEEEALNDLMQSIRQHGLINRIGVRQTAEGFELIDGHRRYLAHQRIGETHIAARIYEHGDPLNPDGIRFAENLHRENLSPMEEARAIRDYLAAGDTNQVKLARILHRSEDWLQTRLALLDLPDDLTIALHNKRLGIAHALCLAQVSDADHRAYLLRYTLDAGATVASVREWVHHWKTAHAAGDGANAPRPEFPEPGQAIVVTLPCYICAIPLPYHQLRILRACPDCARSIAGAGGEASPPAGAPG
jgi:ParB/RepB/Spo0J family partition protein